MKTSVEMIDALGGNAVTAKLLGVGSSAVSNWRRHGVFPPRLAIAVKRIAVQRGLEAPDELFAVITSRADPRSEAA